MKSIRIRAAQIWQLSTVCVLFSSNVVGIERDQAKKQSEAVVSAAQNNERLLYNPANCKNNAEGMVYFAVWDVVFRVPYKDLISIRGISDNSRLSLPKRVDQSEQEGCPGNPLWGKGFLVVYRHQDLGVGKASEQLGANVVNLHIIASDRNRFGLQRVNEIGFERIRETYESCDESIVGLVSCRKPGGEEDSIGDMEVTAYQTKPKYYSTPLGEKLTVLCSGPYVSSVKGRACRVDYKIQENINVSYEFYRKDIPMSNFLKFDRGLRSYIDAAKVEKYIWAD